MTQVPKLLQDGTAVCVAGGPSLTREDVEYCRGRAFVVAINDAYKLAPWAEVLYACDATWWKWNHGVPGFAGLKFALQPHARRFASDVTVLENTGIDGFEPEPTGLRTGKNSGYQAINLSVHLGARRILLLGYDMQRTGGRGHWFGEHPQIGCSPTVFRAHFQTLLKPLRALGVTVVNCSRETALTCFPRQSLAEALA